MSFLSNLYFKKFVPTDNKKIINEIYNYDKVPGMIHIYSKNEKGNDTEGIYPSFSAFRSFSYEQVFCFSKAYGDEQKMSLCTFKEKKSSYMNNISCILGLAFSLDPKALYDREGENAHNIIIRNLTKSTNIPMPNYIIYGKKIQLLYMFQNPVNLQIDSDKKKKLINWVKSIAEKMTEEINRALTTYRVNCKPVPFNEGVNVPGMHMNAYRYDKDKRRMKLVMEGTVSVVKTNPLRLNLKCLSDVVLTQKASVLYHNGRNMYFSGYSEKHSSYFNHKNHVREGFYIPLKEVLANRMLMLKNLAEKNKNMNPVFVFNLAFLYYNFALNVFKVDERKHRFNSETKLFDTIEEKIGFSSAERRADNATLDFMNIFTCGLSEKALLKIKCRTNDTSNGSFKYKNETMFSYLKRKCMITKQDCLDAGLYISDTKKYDKEYSKDYRTLVREKKLAEGKTKLQEMIKKVIKAAKLRGKGMSLRRIAELLKVSVGTVSNYLSYDITSLKARVFA